ncbi:DUF4870 domain-containing protein [Ignavibacterium sp.]|uniref:DUF4870 domain-containing protein n=1 Tax=Ignavibacterium sp. TaxID=2651167 RepID=UPI00307DF2D7
MWFVYLTSIIPLPIFSIPFWFFTANRKPQFAAKCKTLINYQFNLLLFLFVSILLIPLLIGVILILLLSFFHLKFILSALKKNSQQLPLSFTFIK